MSRRAAAILVGVVVDIFIRRLKGCGLCCPHNYEARRSSNTIDNTGLHLFPEHFGRHFGEVTAPCAYLVLRGLCITSCGCDPGLHLLARHFGRHFGEVNAPTDCLVTWHYGCCTPMRGLSDDDHHLRVSINVIVIVANNALVQIGTALQAL